MRSINKLFLLNLFLFLLATRVSAGPKRFFTGEEKPSTAEEQTALNREEAERRASSGDNSEDGEDRVPAKRLRGKTMPCLLENSFQETTATAEETSGSSASSSSLITETTPTRFLWTPEIPTLYRFALERLMRLPAEHPVFRDPLPIQLKRELIEPYVNSMKEIIQSLHKACQKYSLYHCLPEIKKNEFLILFKQKLQQRVADRMEELQTKNYPQAFFEMDSAIAVIPELTIVADSLIKKESFKKQIAVLERDGNLEKAAFLKSALPSLIHLARVAMSIANKKQQLAKFLLGEPSVDQVGSARLCLANEEHQLARVTSLSDHQKLFFDRAEEFTQVEKTILQGFFHGALEILKNLQNPLNLKNQNRVQFFERQLNSYDHMIKASLSKDPRVEQIREKIIESHEKLLRLDDTEQQANILKNSLAFARAERLTILQNGSQETKPESYAPIFELYQIPISFLEKEISLLQTAKGDLLEGKIQLSFFKLQLAQRWGLLAKAVGSTVNTLSQVGMIQTEEDLLTQEQKNLLNFLNEQEDRIVTRVSPFRVDLVMASLPWDFRKTFEENLAAFPPLEEL